MPSTAIVLGATGLVGRSLVQQLALGPHVDRVVSVTRRPVKYESPEVVNRVVDFEHLDDFASIFDGHWLFSALGTTRKQAGSIDAQRIVDVDYQFKAAQLAAMNGVQHYLLVSSSGANASSRNDYLRMKGELEERVIALSFARVSIFRPSLLQGHRDQTRLGEKVGGVVLRALQFVPGVRRYRPIRGDQVAARMMEVSGTTMTERVEVFELGEVFPRDTKQIRPGAGQA